MKCPFCGKLESRVVDSRLTREGEIVRRRRECEACVRRFTTYERVEELLPMVTKQDGRRESFDRQKIVVGVQRACQKRPISQEEIDALVYRVERGVQETGEREISSTVIGELVMNELNALDDVAYVRFASVYRQFKDLNQFLSELNDILKDRGADAPASLTKGKGRRGKAGGGGKGGSSRGPRDG